MEHPLFRRPRRDHFQTFRRRKRQMPKLLVMVKKEVSCLSDAASCSIAFKSVVGNSTNLIEDVLAHLWQCFALVPNASHVWFREKFVLIGKNRSGGVATESPQEAIYWHRVLHEISPNLDKASLLGTERHAWQRKLHFGPQLHNTSQ